MNNYSIYRITETIRVLLFITSSIIVFHSYPVTALMIVLLALLNDVPIMTIAYDNVRYSSEPEKWNMRTLLGIATFLGVIGVVSSFVARTKHSFWSVKPAKPLLIAVTSTQLIATLITVYGILLPAMGWGLAALVWGYALVLFVIADFTKIPFYKILGHSDIIFQR